MHSTVAGLLLWDQLYQYFNISRSGPLRQLYFISATSIVVKNNHHQQLLYNVLSKGTTTGGSGSGPLNSFTDLPILNSFLHGGWFSSVILQRSRLFQDFPFNKIEQYEVQNSKKFLGKGSPRPPGPPSPLFLGLLPQFGLRPIWTPNFWSVVVPLVLSRYGSNGYMLVQQILKWYWFHILIPEPALLHYSNP